MHTKDKSSAPPGEDLQSIGLKNTQNVEELEESEQSVNASAIFTVIVRTQIFSLMQRIQLTTKSLAGDCDCIPVPYGSSYRIRLPWSIHRWRYRWI